jgi:hypothetical protein
MNLLLVWLEALEGSVVGGKNSNSDDYIITALPIHDHAVNYRLVVEQQKRTQHS